MRFNRNFREGLARRPRLSLGTQTARANKCREAFACPIVGAGMLNDARCHEAALFEARFAEDCSGGHLDPSGGQVGLAATFNRARFALGGV